jgi:hypothetical protein
MVNLQSDKDDASFQMFYKVRIEHPITSIGKAKAGRVFSYIISQCYNAILQGGHDLMKDVRWVQITGLISDIAHCIACNNLVACPCVLT